MVEVGGELWGVACCCEAEGFHRDGLGVEFEGVAEVDEGVGESRGEGVEYGGWVGGFLGGGVEEEFQDDGFPVIAHEDELVFKEVDEGALVFPLAEEVAVVVEGDFRGGVFPRVVAFVGGSIFVDFVEVVDGTVEEVG